MISKKLPVDWDLYLRHQGLCAWARKHYSDRLRGLAEYVPPEIIETLPEDALIETCQRWKGVRGMTFATFYGMTVRRQMLYHGSRKKYFFASARMGYPISAVSHPAVVCPDRLASAEAVEKLMVRIQTTKLLRRRLLQSGKRRKIRSHERQKFYELRDELIEAYL